MKFVNKIHIIKKKSDLGFLGFGITVGSFGLVGF
jgi:hypothetical protein